MADWYVDIYRAKPYAERVKTLCSMLASNGVQAFYNEQIAELDKEIEILEAKERSILNQLGMKDSEDFKRHMAAGDKAAEEVSNLTAGGLNKYFIWALKEENTKEFIEFNKKVLQWLNEAGKIIIDNDRQMTMLTEGAVKFVNDELNSAFRSSGRGGKYHAKNFFAPDKTLNALGFTPQQKAGLEKLLEKQKLNKNIEFPGENKITTWYTFTEKLTPTQAKEKYPIGSTELKRIQDNVIEFIINRVTGEAKVGIENILRKDILTDDPYAFFVGIASTDVVGLLGELRSFYILKKTFEGTNVNIRWQGGLFVEKVGADGKTYKQKPHRDIILEIPGIEGNEEIGVQVKNTIKNVSKQGGLNVNFQSASFETVLAKTNFGSFNGGGLIELISTFYKTLNFNVPYHMEYRDGGGVYYEPGLEEWGDWEIYEKAYEDLKKAESKVNLLLSTAAAALMYLDVNKEVVSEFGSNDANVIFFVGNMVYTASDQLKKLKAELVSNSLSSFNVGGYFKKENTTNIITALNDMAREPGYTNIFNKNINFRTAYRF